MRKRHLSDNEVAALLRPSAGEVNEDHAAQLAHLNGCEQCSQRRDELSQLIHALAAAGVWDQSPIPAERGEEWLRRVLALVQQLREEATGLDAILDTTFTGAPANWKARLALLGNVHTYTMADRLVKRCEATFATNPAAAVVMASLAAEIADTLRIDAYPFDMVISVRARAYLESAFTLYYRGHMPEALRALDECDRLFRQLPVSEFQRARGSLVRAFIYRSMDRIPEAISLTGEAATVFAFYGDDERVTKARLAEAAMLIQQHRAAEALPICKSLEQRSALQATPDYGMVLHNLGNCYRDLQQFEKADEYLSLAIAEYEKHNATAEKTRSEWSRANTLVASGRISEALPLLRSTWDAFLRIGLDTDAALTALRLVEVLLATEQTSEVPAICRKLLDHFTRNNMLSRAVTALSFLREAVALEKATPALVRTVADFIRALPAHPTLAFVPPPL